MTTPSLYEAVMIELRRLPAEQWPRIGIEAGVGSTFCRKFVYGQRPNPGWKKLASVAEVLGLRTEIVRTHRAAHPQVCTNPQCRAMTDVKN